MMQLDQKMMLNTTIQQIQLQIKSITQISSIKVGQLTQTLTRLFFCPSSRHEII